MVLSHVYLDSCKSRLNQTTMQDPETAPLRVYRNLTMPCPSNRGMDDINNALVIDLNAGVAEHPS